MKSINILLMIYISTILMICILMGCDNTTPEPVYTVEKADNNVYIGKLMVSDQTIKALKNAVDYKIYTIDVLTGCECDNEVGDRTSQPIQQKDDEQKHPDSAVKKMYIGGDLLLYLQNTDPLILRHMYVTYFLVSAQGQGIIVSAFPNLMDNTPLEKLTIYTSGKSTSVQNTGQNKPAVLVDTVKRNEIPHQTLVDTVKTKSTDSVPPAIIPKKRIRGENTLFSII